MKILIISILLVFTINAQNIWYVDRDSPAGEEGDGTSWTTAWNRIGTMNNGEYGGINWNVIGDGDTIYISGGTDSTLYFPRFVGHSHYLGNAYASPNRTFSQTVVVTNAWQAGHNGTAIIGQVEVSATRLLIIRGLDNIKLTGITLQDFRPPGGTYGSYIEVWGDNNIVENCHLMGAGLSPFIGLGGYHAIIRNNILEDPPNEYTYAQDLFGVSDGRGGHIIENNLMILRNNYTMVNGTASASVTVTNTSLTDTRLSEATDYHVGVAIICGGWVLEITGNSGSNFYGSAGWDSSGTSGNPGNGRAWRMEGAHRDGIQYSVQDGALPTDNLENIVRNNILIDEGTRGTGWNSMVYTSSVATDARFLIYNNIFVNKEEISAGGIFMYESRGNEFSTSLRFFNNTFITKGDAATNPEDGLYSTGGALTLDQLDTLLIKNNLLVCDTGVKGFMFLGSFTPAYFDIDNNIYAADDYNAESFAYNFNGVVKTWDQWRALQNTNGSFRDANSDTMKADAVIFENKYGYLATDYRTLTGVGQGADLSVEYPELLAEHPDIAYDILGNPRGSSWDIGAVQYNGIPPVGNDDINVKSKVFLQGPFNTNSMNTSLSQNGLLPTTQPFNTTPWNYNGNETLGSGSTSSYVDWVLVELRNSSNPTQVVARKAAILKNDGTLLNTDGSNGVPFSNVQEGTYYIAVFHRNHLAVMSKTPVQLSSNSQMYDFTTGMDKAYGTNSMIDLGNSKFGMYAGDGNGNGGITIADRNEVWLPQNGSMGYLKGDFNLDGGVTASDVNLYWNINNGTMTQVP